MKSSTVILIGAAAILSSLAQNAHSQEAFSTCPNSRFCVALTSNGAFYSGNPAGVGDGPFQFNRNVLAGKYPNQDSAGIRIITFQCSAEGMCIALDNKGGFYSGYAAAQADQQGNFQKR
jgi:hypothetical protein